MKILIITYSYSPALTPRAFRWTAIASQFAREGHDVDVLCAAIQNDADDRQDEGITVYRIRDWLLNSLANKASNLHENGRNKKSALSDFRSFLKIGIRIVWRALYWPDYACGWIVPAVRTANELCQKSHYDWVISVSHPFTGHLVGLLVTRRLLNVRWMVDIGDPFHLMKEPANNNSRLYSLLNRWVEQKVLTKANAITVTTKETKQIYLDHFAIDGRKIDVIPPLLSLPTHVAPVVTERGEILKLVFVGTLYRKLRSPKALLELFQSLVGLHQGRKAELHFYGSINDCGELLAAYTAIMPSQIFVHGLVNRTEVMRAMSEADVLVNIGNDSISQLASKVIEYMVMGKPILNLISGDHDISVSTLADYPVSLTIKSDEDFAAPEIDLKTWAFITESKPVPDEIGESVKAKYSKESVAGHYLSLLV